MRPIPAFLLLLIPAPLAAQEPVGTVRFTTSCRPAAQPTFNRAVALLHSFAFATAATEFQTTLKADPDCAMVWWGLALGAWGDAFAAGVERAPLIASVP